MELLRSAHLDMRTTAGEVLALVVETGRWVDDEFLDDYLPELIAATKQLSTDSNKFRSKRDRKAQRATFREVLLYLEVRTPQFPFIFHLLTFSFDRRTFRQKL